MHQILENLKFKIEQILGNETLYEFHSVLNQINSPTLICGVGGSHIVGLFLGKVLSLKNQILIKNIHVEEYFLDNFDNYDNLIVVSYSGKNNGVKKLMKSTKHKYLFSSRKSKISNEILLSYSIPNRLKSFVAIDDTIIPITLALSYYLNTVNLSYSFFNPPSYMVKDFDRVNIIYDYSSISTAYFLESSIVESGIASVTMHSKYSLCHGRSNLISNLDSLTILLISNRSELDKLLLEQLPQISNNMLVMESSIDDPVLSDYDLLIKSLYFLEYLSDTFDKEFVNVKYNRIIPKLYNFGGDFLCQ